jgi:hypothetical protein
VYWQFVRGHVEAALAHANGEITAQDVYQALLDERMYLYVAQQTKVCGAATCEVVQYPRKKAIRVVTVGGEDFPAWRAALLEELKDWARRAGADGIEAFVRRGLVPQLTELGFTHLYAGVWCDVGTQDGEKFGVADNQ